MDIVKKPYKQLINYLRNKDIKIVFIDFPILSETSLSAAKAALAAFQTKCLL